MPRLRSHPFLSTFLLVAALALFSASTLLAQPAPNPQAKPPKTMTWVLTGGAVINRDQIKTDGKFTTGYVVEATATAKGPARVITGKFTIKCTIEEKDGKFLLRGAWDITREGVAEDDPPQPRLHQRDPRGESGLQPRGRAGWSHQRQCFRQSQAAPCR